MSIYYVPFFRRWNLMKNQNEEWRKRDLNYLVGTSFIPVLPLKVPGKLSHDFLQGMIAVISNPILFMSYLRI